MSGDAAPPAEHVEIRELRSATELAALPAFERRIWGGGEPVSVHVLVATIAEGGVALGAFAGERLVGAVYGFPTSDAGVLHSHYLAVDPDHRRRNLGVALKHRQREWCLDHGYTAMRWTFDPLQLANAHLNLEVLGAVGERYHVDHYGPMGGLNGDLPTDRVTVRWDLTGDAARPERALAVDVPPVGAADIAASAPAAHAARLAVREALAPRLAHGWSLAGVDREARRYWLGRLSAGAR